MDNDPILPEPPYPAAAARLMADALHRFLKEGQNIVYPAAAARLMADVLYRVLEEDQGIICQGINEDGVLKHFGVWKSEGQLRIIGNPNPEIPLGSVFHMNDSEGEALAKGTLGDGIVLEM